MPNPMNAQAVMDREFFEMRAKILELAASMDRMDRGEGSVNAEQHQLIRKGIELLLEAESGRAERTQLLFSLPYAENWKQEMGI